MRPPQKCVASLVDRIELNEKFIHLYFEYVQPPVVDFDAGQYVSIQVTEHGDRRSYSICSSPEKNHGFELLVDVSPQGLGTQYLQKMELGHQINLLAPMGVFTVNQDPSEEALLFLATGSGVAPFRSMIEDQLQNKHDQRQIWLYWGMRHAEQLFWMEDFQNLAETYPHFHFHPVISQPLAEWNLCRGRVTDCLNIHQLPDKAGYYLCGNKPMLEEVMTFLATKQVPAEHIHHEKFY